MSLNSVVIVSACLLTQVDRRVFFVVDCSHLSTSISPPSYWTFVGELIRRTAIRTASCAIEKETFLARRLIMPASKAAIAGYIVHCAAAIASAVYINGVASFTLSEFARLQGPSVASGVGNLVLAVR